MAKYYEYGKHQFSFRKYDLVDSSDGSSYDSEEELNHTTIPKEWNVKFGDIIAMKNYRDTGTIFVGIDNKVVHNPDYSCSGYLSIPLEITQWLFDAYWYYKKIFLDKNQPCVNIDLKPDDQWIISKFGKALPEDWKITLWYNWGEFEDISIKFNAYVTQSFGWSVTYDQLIECYKKAIECRSSFNVWYNIFDETNIKKFHEFEKNNNTNLPIAWIEHNSGGGGGMNHEDSQYTYYGPKSDAQKAYQAIKQYYSKFKGKIELHISEPIDGIRSIRGCHRRGNSEYFDPTFKNMLTYWNTNE